MIKKVWLFWDTAHLCQEITETSLYVTWHCPGQMALDIIKSAVVEHNDDNDNDDDDDDDYHYY